MHSCFGDYRKEHSNPNVSELTTQLAEIVTRNAASAVTSRISAIRTRKLDQQAMNEAAAVGRDRDGKYHGESVPDRTYACAR